MFNAMYYLKDFTHGSTSSKPVSVPDYASLPQPEGAEGVIYKTEDDGRLYTYDPILGKYIQMSSPMQYNLVSFLIEEVELSTKKLTIDVESGDIEADGNTIATISDIQTNGGFDYYEERNYFWNGERVEHTKIEYNHPKIVMDLTDIILDNYLYRHDRVIIT